MKTEGQVRHKLQQVLFRHLKKRLEQNFHRSPEGCAHNVEPYGMTVEAVEARQQTPRVCGLQDKVGLICDSRLGGGDQARVCPRWEPRMTKDEVKAEFRALLTRPRGEVAAEFPDAAALMWVLDGDPVVEALEDDGEDLPEELREEEDEGLVCPTRPPNECSYDPAVFVLIRRVCWWRGWPWNWGMP